MATSVSVTDSGMSALARLLGQTGLLYATKAVAHSVDPAAYPLPGTGSLEDLFYAHVVSLPPATSQKAKEKMPALIGGGELASALGPLAGVDLRSSAPLKSAPEILTAFKQVQIDPAKFARERQSAMGSERQQSQNAVRDHAVPGTNTVGFFVNNVHCNSVTGLGIEGDEIEIAGVAIDDSGHLTQLSSVNLGSFHGGDDDFALLSTPYASFEISAPGNWPRSLFVVLVLTELRSGTGLQSFLNGLIQRWESDLSDYGFASGALIGGLIGGPLGALVGLAAGQILGGLIGDALQFLWSEVENLFFSDWILAPLTCRLDIPQPGFPSTPQLSGTVTGFSGSYTIYFGWNAAWNAPHIDDWVLGTYPGSGSNGSMAFQALGGALNFQPAIASCTPGSVDVLAVGADDGLYCNSLTASGWSGFSPVSGVPVNSAGPAAVAMKATRLDVFGRDENKAIYHVSRVNGVWSTGSSIGGATISSPAACSWSDGRLDVFVIGVDGALFHNWAEDDSWSGWQSLGTPPNGALTSGPAAVARRVGLINVVARGADNAVWCIEWKDSAWSSWFSLGGKINYGPAVASRLPVAYEVFAAGTDMQLYVSEITGTGVQSPGSWSPVGVTVSSAPAATLSNPAQGQISVAVRT